MLDYQDIRITSYLPHSGHGAGGMMVGTTTSGIIAHHMPTGLGISCDSERSQHANKEKAIQMLTSLVLAIESERHMQEEQEAFQMRANIPNKVQMIKNVRERTGFGLKESKDAVDLYGDEDLAVLHLLGKPSTKVCCMPQGHPSHCGCNW